MIYCELKKLETVNIKIFKYICKIKYQLIMKAKIKFTVIIVMALGCIMGASAKRMKKSGTKAINIKRLEARLDSVMKSHYDPQSPGAALLIAKNGKAIYDKGIGIADMATGEKIDGNTAFNIASISKQLKFRLPSALQLPHLLF